MLTLFYNSRSCFYVVFDFFLSFFFSIFHGRLYILISVMAGKGIARLRVQTAGGCLTIGVV